MQATLETKYIMCLKKADSAPESATHKPQRAPLWLPWLYPSFHKKILVLSSNGEFSTALQILYEHNFLEAAELNRENAGFTFFCLYCLRIPTNVWIENQRIHPAPPPSSPLIRVPKCHIHMFWDTSRDGDSISALGSWANVWQPSH